MIFDANWLWAGLCVFVRGSAMLLSTPVFGGQYIPVTVRVLTAASVSLSMVGMIQPNMGPMPQDMVGLIGQIANEAAAGLILGTLVSLIFYAVQMAGTFADFQVGLGSSQIINPATGVPVTIMSQIKFMVCVVIFFSINAHHALFRAFVESYSAFPALTMGSLESLQNRLIPLMGDMSLIALQIAAPIAAVGAIVDVGLGIVNKAVPQMQVLVVGMPAKIMLGLIAAGVALPSLVGAVDAGVSRSLEAVWQIYAEQARSK